MKIVVKFGGSSLASAEQFKKVADIIHADPHRRFVVPSAPGKRFDGDTKVTDMLYKCYAEAEAGKNFDKQLKAIEERYNEIIKGLSLKLSLKEQFETIKKIAEKESCVIVGRCADYALSDNPDCINVFIHADLDVRIKNVSRNLNITENKARDIINKTDKQRASYYNYYTSKKWGDSKSYNLSLDAGKLGTDNCVEMILKFRELMDAMK